MAQTFVDQLAQSRYGPMVRCGVHNKSLQAKRMSIADAERFVEQVDRDIKAQSGKLNAANLMGITAWMAIVVSDIVLDAYQMMPGQKANLVLTGLIKTNAYVHNGIYKNSRYAAEIEKIDKATKILKARLPDKAKGLAELYSSLAKNMFGLAGFADDGIESRAALDQSIRTSQANVGRLRELLKKIDAQIADDARSDDGGPAPVRSEALPPQGAVSMPGLR